MPGFRCPFCGQIMSVGSLTHSSKNVSFFANTSYDIPQLRVDIYKCPNDSCNEETVFVSGENGYIGGKTILVYPESGAIRFPEYIPGAIRSDYEEACAILNKSPKASATLARRCLQGMIRDFWEIKKNRLIDEINALQGKIPAAQWMAIDALRQLGNIGAHMEKDVNTIVDIDEGEADKLLQLIELLMEKWYINRNDEQALYNSIVSVTQAKKNAPTA